MRDLNYQLKQLGQRNRDGSFATRADRARMLALFANQLHGAGFRHMRADSLKPKHVAALLERWQGEGLSAATIKNRLANLLGHRSGRITTHYSAAELSKLLEAANSVCETDRRVPDLVVLRRLSVG